MAKTNNTGSSLVDEKVKTLWDLKEGDTFRFPYDPENRIRTLCQKGKTEGYCPYDGQNTMGHSMSSGDEVYLLSAKVILLTKPSQTDNTVYGHTPGKLFIDEQEDKTEIHIASDKDPTFSLCQLYSDPMDKETKANAARIVECWNGYDWLKAANRELLEALKQISEELPNPSFAVTRIIKEIAENAITKHTKP